MQPPEGPPVCTALNLPAVRDAAADVEDDLPQRDAHGHLDQARAAHAAGQGEDLGPLALAGADAGEPAAALADDGRDVGVGLHVVQQRRAAPQAVVGRVWRARARRAPPALDGRHQGRLLAADERPGAEPQLDVEAERRAHHVAAQHAHDAWPRGWPWSGARWPAGTRRARRCSRAARRRRRPPWPCPPGRGAGRSPGCCGP